MKVTIPSKLRLLAPAVMVAAIALGYPGLAGAAPSDPSGGGGWDQQYYDWCMAWAGFESDKLKCCSDAGGSNVPTGPGRGDTVCVAPGGAAPAPPGGGAGPAPVGTGPRPPVPRLPVVEQPDSAAPGAAPAPPGPPPTSSTTLPPPPPR